MLYIEVGPNGTADSIKVQRSLGMGLDEKAIEAVNKWRFRPGVKDGKPFLEVKSGSIKLKEIKTA